MTGIKDRRNEDGGRRRNPSNRTGTLRALTSPSNRMKIVFGCPADWMAAYPGRPLSRAKTGCNFFIRRDIACPMPSADAVDSYLSINRSDNVLKPNCQPRGFSSTPSGHPPGDVVSTLSRANAAPTPCLTLSILGIRLLACPVGLKLKNEVWKREARQGSFG